MSETLVLHDERIARILLVEDNPGDILLLKRMLKNAQINNSIDVARTGEEVLSLLKQREQGGINELPDLILLDLNLPGISGHSVLDAIKKQETTKHIPVVILSSSQTEIEQQTSQQLGACGYFVKPMNRELFNKLLLTLKSYRFSLMDLSGDQVLKINREHKL